MGIDAEAPAGETAGNEMRSANEQRILDIVRRHSAIARADITALTLLTQQSVHRLVDGLIEAGLLRAGEGRRAGRGQPSPLIELVPEARIAFGLSINTDSIHVCLADLSCRILAEERLDVSPEDREAALRAVARRLDEIRSARGWPGSRVVGVGLGISGYKLAERRRINAPEPLRDWSLIDLQAAAQRHFPYPVQVANNAKTGAIGESLQGVGRRLRSFAYLSFNYGFGGGLVIDGTPYFGAHENAGEFSAMLSVEDGPNRPALGSLIETLQAHGVAVSSIGDLRGRFDPAWPGVEAWLERVQPMTTRIVNGIAAVIDPEAIVFGGQIPPALAQRLIEGVSFFSKGRYGEPLPRPQLLVSETEGDAPALGAALLPMKGRFLP